MTRMTGRIDSAAAARRLLQRTGFDAAPQAVAAVLSEGFSAALRRIVVPSAAPDAGRAATPPPHFTEILRPKATDKAARAAYQKRSSAQREALIIWWLDRMYAVVNPWIEKRTLLWHDHWATSIAKVHSAGMMLTQNELERSAGGGDFDSFARTMVRDPAMLVWLDASNSTAKALNENLGRELMELFTLGFGHYSETDVRQAALALTGWRVNRRSKTPVAHFIAANHAAGPETILGTTASFTDQSLVDLLVSRPDSARYLAGRMWGWLVSAAPPSDSALERITAAYGTTHDLTAMFSAIISDPAFLDPSSVLVKQPIEYVVGMLRSLRLRPSTLNVKSRKALLAGLSGLGQLPFTPPSVGGWPSGSAWLTTSAAQARLLLAGQLVRAADLSALTRVERAARPGYLASLLGVGRWSPATSRVLDDAAGQPVELVTLALGSPDYVVSS